MRTLRTLTLVTVVAALAAGSVVAVAASTPLFAGVTAKHRPIYFRLTAAGDRVKELRVTWTDSCARRTPKVTVLSLADDVRISGAAFSATRRYRESGTRRPVTFFVTGTLGTVARGRFAVRAKQGSRTCRTGMVGWTARLIP